MGYDLIIVGAGPVGSHLASLVAKQGHSVLLLEEHETIGEPVQCAGLVTERAIEMTGVGRDCVLREIRGARLMGPEAEEIVLSAPKKKVLAIDRSLFDKKLGEKAREAGAEVRTGVKVKDVELDKEECIVTLSDGKTERSKYVAGCDGPASVVRRKMGFDPPKMLSGLEVEVSIDWEDDKVVVRSSRNIAPGFFAWAIPLGKGKARIGLAVDPELAGRSAKTFLEQIIQEPALLGLPPFTVEKWLGGGIPLSPPKNVAKERMLLAGDAACQVKATSGGGVVMGLRCAEHAAKTISEAIENGGGLESYDRLWHKDVGGELRRDWALHRYHSNMDNAAQTRTFKALSSPKTLDKINRMGDIDYPSKLVLPLLLGNPHLLRMLPGLLWRYLFV